MMSMNELPLLRRRHTMALPMLLGLALGAGCTHNATAPACEELLHCCQRLSPSLFASCREAYDRAQIGGDAERQCELAQGSLGASCAAGDGGANVGEAPAGDAALGGAAICEQYIACSAALTPAALAPVLAAYGSEGSCWGSLGAAQCESACRSGLTSLRLLPGGDNEACAQCNATLPCSDPELPACVDGECIPCSEDRHCSFGGCDWRAQRCVDCLQDTDCSGASPACDATKQRCVGCTADAHCPTARPACDRSAARCVTCLQDAHCPPATPRCLSTLEGGRCVACTGNTDCPTTAPHCANGLMLFEAATFSCGPCRRDDECADDERCDSITGCRPIRCEDLPASCGDYPLGPRTLSCGGCLDGLSCSAPQGTSGHACRQAIGAGCAPQQADSCGAELRCVWAPPYPAEVGVCTVDVATSGCASSCRYTTNQGGISGFCETTTDYCGPRCLPDGGHCRANEICTPPDRQSSAGAHFCLPR